MQESDWGVVVVIYNPEITSFSKRITRYLTKTDHVVVVNNGDSLAQTTFASQVIELGGNVGIARAQNIGVQALREKKLSLYSSLIKTQTFRMVSFIICLKNSRGFLNTIRKLGC